MLVRIAALVPRAVELPARERLSGSLRKRFDSARRRASEQLALRQVKERIVTLATIPSPSRSPLNRWMVVGCVERVESAPPRSAASGGLRLVNPFSGTSTLVAPVESAAATARARNRSERLRLEGSRLGPRCATTTRKAGKGGGRCAESHALTRFCAPLTIVLSAWLRSRRGVRPSARMAPQKESRPPLSNATTSALSWGPTFAAGGGGCSADTCSRHESPLTQWSRSASGSRSRRHGSGSTICTWRPMLRMKLRGRRVRRSPTYAATANRTRSIAETFRTPRWASQGPSLASMVPGSSP